MKKKKIIIIISIIIIILIITSIIFIKTHQLKIDYQNKIEVSINQKIYNTDNIKNIKNGKLITSKEQIDTSKLGKQEITFKVKNYFGQEKEYHYEINIYDNESPKITSKKELTTEKGTKIDLLQDVQVTDNSLEDIDVTIEGEYDFNKEGNYTLYYVAKDSSNNETRQQFTLIVKEKEQSNSNNNETTNNNSNKTFTTSKGFTGTIKNGVTYIDGYLIANKTYGLPSTYNPGLTSTTKEAFNKMQAAAKLDGIDIYIASGFRSYQTQKNLYNNYVNRDGQKLADTYSARPGNSEHQSGLAFDVCSHDLDGKDACINSNFNNTSQAKWLSNNAYKYGFILRYPEGKTNETGYKYESWHFRYVGTDLATKLYNNGNWITMENYFGITSEY